MRRLIQLFVVAVFSACAGNSGIDDTDAVEGVIDPEDRPLLPGLWRTVDMGIHNNTCGGMADSFVGGEFRVDWLDEVTFEIREVQTSPTNGSILAPCTVDGDEVDCDYDEEPVVQQVTEGATLSFVWIPTDVGTIASNDVLLETFSVSMECEGDDCERFGSQFGGAFPCAMDMDQRNEWLGFLSE